MGTAVKRWQRCSSSFWGDLPDAPDVDAIFLDNRLVYIWQSPSVRHRMQTHSRDDFNIHRKGRRGDISLRFALCGESEASRVWRESRLLNRLSFDPVFVDSPQSCGPKTWLDRRTPPTVVRDPRILRAKYLSLEYRDLLARSYA